MKSTLLLLCLTLAASVSASAQTQAPAPGPDPVTETALPYCSLTPDGTRLAVEPCRKAPQKVPRRSVMQVVGRMPQQKTATGGHPVAPMPLTSIPSPAPSAPIPLNSCGPGACRDTAGGLHVTGAGNTSVDAKGRLCTQHAGFLQCF